MPAVPQDDLPPGASPSPAPSVPPPAPPSGETWRSVQEARAQILHQHIFAYQHLIGVDKPSLLRQACAPYYRMLEEIYRDDMPLADTLDRSDLVARMEGPAVSSRALPLAVVTALLTDMQAQLGAMVRTIAGGLAPGLEWPRDLDFGLSSFARGSLYLGFELPQPPDGTLFLRDDPLVASARESLRVLGTASRLAATDAPFAELYSALPDPHIRDAALAAVERLSPTGRRGIVSLSLTGRCFGDQDWRLLSPETRQRARAWMESEAPSRQFINLQGIVRQVDLDQRRFDLRTDQQQTVGQNQRQSRTSRKRSPQDGGGALIRCRYAAPLDRMAKTWLGRSVIVEGEAELYDGKPRLVHALTVKIASDTEAKPD